MRFLFKKKASMDLPMYGWFGNYDSWKVASQLAAGYHQPNILSKTKDALSAVRDGDAVYERDSVLFDRKEYPFPLITSLLYIAAHSGNRLNVLDFGGSLGSSYFQVRDFLSPLRSLSWNIVEQEEYVQVGRAEFESEQLKFYHTIEESIAIVKPDVILLSSVVQYLPQPHDFLESVAALNLDFVLFDRTAFVREGGDRLTIQKVPPEIYEASYPSWFFNETGFLKHFSQYRLKVDFMSYVTGESDMLIDGVLAGYDKGFLLIRNNEN